MVTDHIFWRNFLLEKECAEWLAVLHRPFGAARAELQAPEQEVGQSFVRLLFKVYSVLQTAKIERIAEDFLVAEKLYIFLQVDGFLDVQIYHVCVGLPVHQLSIRVL